MAIKINSGWCRGLVLKSPPTLHTRPTASRTREAVWNSLQFELQGIDILDLFCGSGAVGLEAVSRGAGSCLFADNSPAAIRCLRQNIKAVEERARSASRSFNLKARQGDALSILKGQNKESVDLLWLDPPYDIVSDQVPLIAPLAQAVLRSRGKMIIECDERGLDAIALLREQDQWSETKHKRYGKTYITIFEKG